MAAQYLMTLAGLTKDHAVGIHYKGGGEVTTAVLGGQVHFACNNAPTVISQIKAGALRGHVRHAGAPARDSRGAERARSRLPRHGEDRRLDRADGAAGTAEGGGGPLGGRVRAPGEGSRLADRQRAHRRHRRRSARPRTPRSSCASSTSSTTSWSARSASGSSRGRCAARTSSRAAWRARARAMCSRSPATTSCRCSMRRWTRSCRSCTCATRPPRCTWPTPGRA